MNIQALLVSFLVLMNKELAKKHNQLFQLQQADGRPVSKDRHEAALAATNPIMAL
jgi:hypothetical protein